MDRFLRWTGRETVFFLTAFAWLCTGVTVGIVLSSDPDYLQGENFRLLYWHVPAAWWSLWAYGGATIGAFLYLWRKNPWWDRVSGAWCWVSWVWAIGCVWTGMLWGKTTWGVYWVWDARLTSMAALVAMLSAVPLIRRQGTAEQGAKRAAYWVLFGAWNVPLIKASVDWWNTLHQSSTITLQGSSASPSIVYTLGFATLAAWCWTLVWWIYRLRTSLLADRAYALTAYATNQNTSFSSSTSTSFSNSPIEKTNTETMGENKILQNRLKS